MRRVLATLLVVIVVAIVAGLGVMYSGVYNVAASAGHADSMRWVLDITMQQSVHRHAEGIETPADLAEPQRVEQGARAYAQMCAICHLAPGKEATGVHEGLLPAPPSMEHAVEHWDPPQLFWIVKHGIKMTGMPAWGATHDDEELWDIVAFIRQLPEMSEQRYQELAFGTAGEAVAAADGSGDGHDHGHADGHTH